MAAQEKENCGKFAPRTIFLFFVLLLAVVYLNMSVLVIVIRRWSSESTPQLIRSIGKNLFSFIAQDQDKQLPEHLKATNISIIMQYKVSNNKNMPEEFRGGHPLLRTRTYPTMPRNESCHQCFKYIYDSLLRPTSCDAPGKIKLLVFITTVPDAIEDRRVSRKTWLSLTQNNTKSVRYMWLFGSGWPAKEQAQIEKESLEFGDVLQDDYTDSYFNLSIKVMSAYNYTLKACNRVEFVLRTADDNYVNIPNILDLVNHEKQGIQNSVYGYAIAGPWPIRYKESKWAVTVNEWGESRYPRYLVGTAFVMNYETMKTMFEAAENVPYFVMEDVFFGEVSRQANIKLVHNKNFLLPPPGVPCKLKERWTAVHPASPRLKLRIWNYCSQSKSIP